MINWKDRKLRFPSLELFLAIAEFLEWKYYPELNH